MATVSTMPFLFEPIRRVIAMAPNNAHLIVLGEMLVASAFEDFERTAENIQEMHTTEEGAEMLRRIVRDDLGGAADVVSAVLWPSIQVAV